MGITTRVLARHHGLAAIRLGVGALAGLVTLVVVLVLGGAWAVAVTGSWVAAAVVVLVWVWLSLLPKDVQATAAWAQAEDFSRGAADVVLLSASVASLVAIGFVLVQAGQAHGATKMVLIGLTVLSVTTAWASVHTVFMLKYGDLYYTPPIGGIDFHDQGRPDYRDLAYVALTVGMTFQVSDTDLVTRPIRRTALLHALLSFLFVAVIVAITINIVASLLSK